MMLRFISTFVLAAVLLLQGAGIASAAVPDNGPPYTDAQFIALSAERLPTDFRKTLPEWWARAPDYLRKHVLNSPSDRWWHIILCNFMGFKPNVSGPENSKKCEDDSYRASQRNKSNWGPNGEWLGPSEACRKRDKRSEWGELICD
jgi:hypothetical protein